MSNTSSRKFKSKKGSKLNLMDLFLGRKVMMEEIRSLHHDYDLLGRRMDRLEKRIIKNLRRVAYEKRKV